MLYGLSSDEDLTTLHYVACTLVRLGMEEQCHARMIQEGAARYELSSKCIDTDARSGSLLSTLIFLSGSQTYNRQLFFRDVR